MCHRIDYLFVLLLLISSCICITSETTTLQYLANKNHIYGSRIASSTTTVENPAVGNNYFVTYFDTAGIQESGVLTEFGVLLEPGSGFTQGQIVVARRGISSVDGVSPVVRVVARYSPNFVSSSSSITRPYPVVEVGDFVGVAITSSTTLNSDPPVPSRRLMFHPILSRLQLPADTPIGTEIPYTTADQQQYKGYTPRFTYTVQYQAMASIPGCDVAFWRDHPLVNQWNELTGTTRKTTDRVDSILSTDWTLVTSPARSTSLINALKLGATVPINNVFKQAVAAYLSAETYGTAATYTTTQVKNEFTIQTQAATPDATTLQNWANFCNPPTPSPTPTPTPSPENTGSGNNGIIDGDPMFAGFQGQSFQFHGLADEIFNLISSPSLQVNSHFVYLSSGRCDYNDTACYTHPGTYLDELGFSIRSEHGIVQVRVVAGSHNEGLRVRMGRADSEVPEVEITPKHDKQDITWKMSNQTMEKASVHFTHRRDVTIRTPTFHIKVVNSDYFFNLEIAVLDPHLLRLGARPVVIDSSRLCSHPTHQHDHDHDHADDASRASASSHDQHHHGLVEQALLQAYGVDAQLHGLIGQTWRNAKICGKYWSGAVADYIVPHIFGSGYYYDFFNQ